MFSEYASRFLAQSQSRLSFGHPDTNTASRNPLDRQRGVSRGSPRTPVSRNYVRRQGVGNPYQAGESQMGRFPFASRATPASAPLFYSATDELREDDGEEHEREVADFYALQRSRRQFGNSHLTESSELEDEAGDSLTDQGGEGGTKDMEQEDFSTRRGIRSSWKGGEENVRGRGPETESVRERDESVAESEASALSGKSKGKLVDVELASTMRDSIDDIGRDEASSVLQNDEPPPAFQKFRQQAERHISRSMFLPRETDEETALGRPRPPSPDTESVPPTTSLDIQQPPQHDRFWATLFLLSLAATLTWFFFEFLHTSPPSRRNPLGDTMYTVLHKSFFLLASDTAIAVFVSLFWLALLRSFVRPLVLTLLVAVPVILSSFSLYPLVSSYKGAWDGNSFQDKAMRWFALLPGIMAVLWTYTVFRGRHSFGQAIEIMDFACRILAASPALLGVGFGILAGIIAWTWLWIGMFTRLFLGGYLSMSKHTFVIYTGTWWLGAFYVLIYLWGLSVLSGIQRATTAATVSQWYFHRLTVPTPSSRAVVQASFSHAIGPLFGTICLSTFLSLAVRLPLLILPRRVAGLLGLCIYSLIPTPIATLTNPLTLTYAAIHSRPLTISARGLSQMPFASKTSPTTTLSPRSFSSSTGSTLLPYRLAKLLLHATRFIMSFALGFGGWVATARMLDVDGSGVKGSLYAYVIGLIAGAIGWGVMGATEGILGGIVDATVICWGSETRAGAAGEARYCREAGELYGERRFGREMV
ncbi:hypothetical protein BJ546DRAFT_1002470 [Cryomyces antarcticus]|nr:hypothetical protein LTR39_001965 [Cryomyces antarcticus]